MEVTGLAGNGRELIELIEKGRKALPDVVLMDCLLYTSRRV